MTGKFRAWDKEQKKYAAEETLKDLFIDSNGKVMGYGNTTFIDVTDRYDIEWETGCTDVDNRPIYQSDTALYHNSFGNREEMAFTVEWSCDGWELDRIPLSNYFASGYLKIIGTIHSKGSE